MTERLPEFNLVVSVAALALLLYAWWADRLPARRIVRAALVAASVGLIAGSAFQANLIDQVTWTVIGSGGRLFLLALIVVAVFGASEPVDVAIERVKAKIETLNGTEAPK